VTGTGAVVVVEDVVVEVEAVGAGWAPARAGVSASPPARVAPANAPRMASLGTWTEK